MSGRSRILIVLVLLLFAGCWQSKPVAQAPPVTAPTSNAAAQSVAVHERVAEPPPDVAQDDSATNDKTTVPKEAIPNDPPSRELPRERFLLLVPGGPLIVEVACTIDGLPLGDSLEQLIADMLKLADADHDGRATWDELTNQPRFMRGVYGNEPIDTDEKRRQVIQQYDINRDKRVNHDEVTRFLTKNSGSSRPFLVQSASETGDMSRRESLVRRLLDADEDGVLDAEEIAAAAERLRSRDADDDEMIYLTDLQPVTNVQTDDRPRRRVWGPDAAMLVGPKMDRSAVLLTLQEAYALGGSLTAQSFPQRPQLFARLDADNNRRVFAKELDGLLEVEADLSLEAHFGRAADSSAETPRLVSRRPTFVFGDEEVTLAERPRQIDFALPEMRVQFLIQDTVGGGEDAATQANAIVAQYDANKDGYLEKSELPEDVAGRVADFDAFDADGDGKVYPAEIASLLRRQRMAGVSVVRAQIRQPEDALFAALDTNHDGRLDWREVQAAPERLRALDRNHDGRVDVGEIPTSLIVMLTRGESSNNMYAPVTMPSPANPVNKDAPPWFLRMDANGDGAISSREFLGDTDQFRQLDANGDGFLEWSEMASSQKKSVDEP